MAIFKTLLDDSINIICTKFHLPNPSRFRKIAFYKKNLRTDTRRTSDRHYDYNAPLCWGVKSAPKTRTWPYLFLILWTRPVNQIFSPQVTYSGLSGSICLIPKVCGSRSDNLIFDFSSTPCRTQDPLLLYLALKSGQNTRYYSRTFSDYAPRCWNQLQLLQLQGAGTNIHLN